MFDQFYEESSQRADVLPIPVPPLYFEPARAEQKLWPILIGHMKSHKGVWFATGSEIAHWWLEKGFSAEAMPRFRKWRERNGKCGVTV